jgi:hypothetical protein
VSRPDTTPRFVGDDYTYEPRTGMLAIRKDAQTVSFRVGSPYGPYDVDFGPQLDGAITDIEWLPPLFFYEP